MMFAKDRPIKIIMLGAGGTGGHIAPHLYRLCHALDRQVKIIICDGDLVEEKNLIRQNFIAADLGRNKAQVLAERYSTAFGLETLFVPNFIEAKEMLTILITPEHCHKNTHLYKTSEELVILIGAVDNNKSRRLCHEVFMTAKDLIYIDSGNGEFTGQVVCGIRRKGRTYYKPVGDIYNDILEATDKFPTELSCAEASLSVPQTIATNLFAAT